MATAKKSQKKAPGRPKKSEDEKLEQFSIRLTPKLKFGLELLARAQNRSLSQAVEWALQVGLNSYRVNNEWDDVAGLLDKAWAQDAEFDRLYTIYISAPHLLTFEDRAACEVVEQSIEMEMSDEGLRAKAIADDWQADKYRDDAEFEKLSAQERQRKEIFKGFVRAYWPQLKKAAIEHVSSGKSLRNVRLSRLLGLSGTSGFDEFALMLAATEFANGSLKPDDFPHRVTELDNSLPWSRSLNRATEAELSAINPAEKPKA